MKFDFWYNNTIEDVEQVSCYFSDVDCIYWGNLYKDGNAIGDYTATDSVELENQFPGIFGN
jgi:hypothetical protein